MTYNVVLYKNTGFDMVNRPSEPTLLVDADKILQQAIFDWQDLDKATIKISADFDTVCDVDYACIDNKYYIVTGIRMTSGNTAELSLMLDPIATAGGVSSLTAISGWCTRHHVASDGMFEWVTDENYIPHNRLELVTPERIGPEALYYGDGTIVGVACASVDLTDLQKICDFYGSADTSVEGDKIAVPTMPIVPKPTYVGIRDGGVLKRYTIPLCGCYIHSFQGVVDPDTDINRGLRQVRSLGIESAIKKVYVIPSGYLTASNMLLNGSNQRKIDGFVSDKTIYTPSADFNYAYGAYTPKNKKVYTLCNNYTVYSVCSGGKKEFKATDLYSGGTSPDFYVYADFGPNGKPYIQPTYFDGNKTVLFQESVMGAEWIDEPLSYAKADGSTVASGAAWTDRERAFRGYSDAASLLTDAIGYVGSVVGGVLGTSTGPYIGAKGREQQALRDYTEMFVYAPDASFTVDRAVQGFVGNTFYITRTRLSEEDMRCFDEYLTQFGYSDGVAFEMSFLTNRVHFNYIKTQGASVKCTAPLRVRNAIAALLDSGVRLWHELPNTAAMSDNPIAT